MKQKPTSLGCTGEGIVPGALTAAGQPLRHRSRLAMRSMWEMVARASVRKAEPTSVLTPRRLGCHLALTTGTRTPIFERAGLSSNGLDWRSASVVPRNLRHASGRTSCSVQGRVARVLWPTARGQCLNDRIGQEQP